MRPVPGPGQPGLQQLRPGQEDQLEDRRSQVEVLEAYMATAAALYEGGFEEARRSHPAGPAPRLLRPALKSDRRAQPGGIWTSQSEVVGQGQALVHANATR